MDRNHSPTLEVEEEKDDKMDIEQESVVDPVEIIFPMKKKKAPSLGAKTPSKGRRKSQGKIIPEESSSSVRTQRLSELAQLFINRLNTTLNSNLAYFEGLLLDKIAETMQKTKDPSETPISLVVIEDSLQFSLNTLRIDNMLNSLANMHKAVGIRLKDSKSTSLKLLLNQIKDGIAQHKGKYIQKLILFFDYYVQEDGDTLSFLLKYIEEDLLTHDRTQKCKVTIILPSLCPRETDLETEVDYSTVKLSSSISLVSKMIVDLLCDCEFFPIFSKSIIRHLLSLYDFYELSPRGFISRLAVIVQDYLFKIKDHQMTEMLKTALLDRGKVGSYGTVRPSIGTAVKIFYEIEKLAMSDIEESDRKCVKLFINKEESYTLPETIFDEITSLDEVLELAEQIGKLITEATNDKGIREYGKKLLDLSKPAAKKTKGRRSTSKAETPKKKKGLSEIQTVFGSINEILSEFFAANIITAFEELLIDYPYFVYSDLESLRSSVSPDFVGDILTFLNSEKRSFAQQRPGFRQFIQSVQEYNIGIDINQCLNAFKETIDGLKETAINKKVKANADMLFYLYVSELKYIGLIVEKGRGKMCFQKDYFAKTFHNTANFNDEEDDEM